MTIGTWYYPKNWPRERWPVDVERMADAGFEYVRTGVFYWSRVEPRRGEFDVEWLDDALDLYHEHGLQAVLGTPTGAPPKWLVDQHPDILQEGPDGTVRGFGSRRHYCYNSPTYRRETERIVSKLAEHFAGHPAVAGWQVDNEFGCHDTTRCYCADCADAFRDWLAERYGDVDALNDAWGTSFWSQRHDSFNEVDPPRTAPTNHHPSRLLDFYRFSSDSVVAYSRLQADLLREADDDPFVTTNFMGDFPELDAGRVSDDLDLVTWNSYPLLSVQGRGQGPTPDELRAGDPGWISMNHDLYRGLGDGPFWIMEQQAGDIMAFPYSPEPADGAMRLWAHHATAHGADNVNYFRYRRCREGQEQYWGGLVKHDGTPDRGFHEARRAAAELEDLGDLGPVEAPVAVLHDYDNAWAIGIQPHAPDFDYWAHLRAYYRALGRRGVGVDLVPPERDLEGYDAVVAPTLHLVDDGLAATLEGYVDGGGELLLSARSGVKDRANKLLDELPPGPLADLAGARVDQHESLPETLETRVGYDGGEYEYRTWGEWLAPEGAAVAGEHASGPAAGEPAITHHDRGDGSVAYCGVWPEPPLADAVVANLLDRAGVPTTEPLPDGVQVTGRGEYTWVTNFRAEPVAVDAPGDAEWVLGDATVGGYDLAVCRASPADLTVRRS